MPHGLTLNFQIKTHNTCICVVRFLFGRNDNFFISENTI